MASRSVSMTLLITFALLALIAAGCGGPKSGELDKSQKRQSEQIAAEEGEAAPEKESPKTDEVKPDEPKAEDPKAPAKDDKPATDTTKPAKTDDVEAEAGKLDDAALDAARTLFATTCGGCHVLADAETAGTMGPNLDDSKLDAAAIAKQIENGGGGMPGGMLAGDEAESVAAYVAQVAGS